MGINITRNSGSYTYITAGEDIAAGDLVTTGYDDGLAYWALNPTHAHAAQRPISQTSPINNVVSDTVSITARGGHAAAAAIKLSTGNIAVFSGAVTTSYPTLYIYDHTGATVVSAVTVESVVGNSSNMAMCELSDGNIALAYSGAGNASPRRAVYSATGTQVFAATAIETVSGVAGVCIAPLTGGGFVVGYYRTATDKRQSYFARFNNAGALQGSVTAVSTASGTNKNRAGRSMAVAGLTGGGFVIAHYVTNSQATAQQTPYVNIYSSAGVLQGSQIAIASSLSSGYAGSTIELQFALQALSDGGFAWGCWAAGSTPASKFGKMSSAGVAVGSEHATTAGTAAMQNPGPANIAFINTALADGSFLFAASNGDAIMDIGYVSTTGTKSTWTSGTSTSGSLHWAYDSVTGEYLLAAQNGQVTRYAVGTTSLANGNSPSSTTSAVGDHPNVFAAPLAGNIKPGVRNFAFIGVGTSSSTIKYYATKVQAQVMTGVAVAAATAGNPVMVCIRGPVQLRLTFKFPYALDARALGAYPGQKMTVTGNLATLHGSQVGDVVSTNVTNNYYGGAV